MPFVNFLTIDRVQAFDTAFDRLMRAGGLHEGFLDGLSIGQLLSQINGIVGTTSSPLSFLTTTVPSPVGPAITIGNNTLQTGGTLLGLSSGGSIIANIDYSGSYTGSGIVLEQNSSPPAGSSNNIVLYNSGPSLLAKINNATPSVQINPYHISVKDYGAKGDGIADDTAAIIAADHACGAAQQSYTPYWVSSSSPVLFFPKGVYKHNGTVSTYAAMLDGENSILLNISATQATRVLSAGKVTVSNLIFIGGHSAIKMATGDVSHSLFEINDCEFQAQTFACIESDNNSNSSYVHVHQCNFTPADGGSVANLKSGDGWIFRDCTFSCLTNTSPFIVEEVALVLQDCTGGGVETDIGSWITVNDSTDGTNLYIRNVRMADSGKIAVTWNCSSGLLYVRDSPDFSSTNNYVFTKLPGIVDIDHSTGNGGGVFLDPSIPLAQVQSLGNSRTISTDGSYGKFVGNTGGKQSYAPGSDPTVLSAALVSDILPMWAPLFDPSGIVQTIYNVPSDVENTYMGGDSSYSNATVVGSDLVVNPSGGNGAFYFQHHLALQNLLGVPGLYTAVFHITVKNQPVQMQLFAGGCFKLAMLPVGTHLISVPFHLTSTSATQVGTGCIAGNNAILAGYDWVRICKGLVRFNEPRVHAFATSLPTTGRFLVGDIIEYTTPTPGSVLGAVCTTKGRFAPAWQASTVYSAAAPTTSYVTNDTGKVYRATSTTGDAKSDSSGGPTGTGGSIVDNHVTWTYIETNPVFKNYGTISS